MSAWMVSKEHVDVLVSAALELQNAHGQVGAGRRCSWWQVDENGHYAGWRRLEQLALDEDEETVSPSQLGQMLVDENVRSILYRYPDCSVDAADLPGSDVYVMPYVYTDPRRAFSPGEVFKAIDCLDYQSCEHPSWRLSEAFAFLSALRDYYCTRVGGYDAAPWGWEASDLAGVAA